MALDLPPSASGYGYGYGYGAPPAELAGSAGRASRRPARADRTAGAVRRSVP